jgi:hypothetical protein
VLCFELMVLCLINATLTVMHDYKLKRHYDTKHASKYSVFEGYLRSDKLYLKSQLSANQLFQGPHKDKTVLQ